MGMPTSTFSSISRRNITSTAQWLPSQSTTTSALIGSSNTKAWILSRYSTLNGNCWCYGAKATLALILIYPLLNSMLVELKSIEFTNRENTYHHSLTHDISHFLNIRILWFITGTNSRASKSWVDSMVKQVLSNLHRGVPLSEAGGMSNGMVTTSRQYWLTHTTACKSHF